jgi:hypothetical protein
MAENNSNEWSKWLIRFFLGGIWGAIVVILLAFDGRISATGKASSDSDEIQNRQIAELSACSKATAVEISYIKQSITEQKDMTREILKEIRAIRT